MSLSPKTFPPLCANPPEAEPRTAPLQEIFSSIQGEGVYVGKRQIFVRFAHCHLHCRYCDTPMQTPDGRCHVETEPGSGIKEFFENPMTPEALMTALTPLARRGHPHSVSFTGGEPLLYHRFLAVLFPQVQALGLKTYLETSGTQPEFLPTVLPHTDIIAMDIKLPSATGEAPQFENHREFYRLAQQRPETELFIKLVLNASVTEDELQAVETIVSDRRTPILLQPETDANAPVGLISPARLLAVQERLSETFADVRVIPQTHKMLQIL